MAKKPAAVGQSPDPNEVPVDEHDQLPPATRDQSHEDAPQPAVEAPALDAEPEPKEPAKPTPHDARKAVFDSIKKKRSGEAPAEIEAPDPNSHMELGSAYQQLRPSEAPETLADAEPAPTPIAPVRHKLRVDHREVELTQEELEQAARIGLAQGNRVPELNALIQQTRQTLAEVQDLRQNGVQRDPSASQQPEPPADPSRETPPRARGEDLRQIAERLQVGDAAEGVQALEAFRADLLAELGQAQPSATPEEIAAQVETRLRASEAERIAGESFRSRHPEIADDQVMQAATIMAMHTVLVEEMRNLGVEEQYLRDAQSSPQKAIEFHNDLRRQGYQLSTGERVSELAASAVETRYNLTAARQPAPPTPGVPAATISPANGQSRIEVRDAEKRQLQQPRRANVVSRQPAAPQPRSRSDVIAAERTRRGFTNLS